MHGEAAGTGWEMGWRDPGGTNLNFLGDFQAEEQLVKVLENPPFPSQPQALLAAPPSQPKGFGGICGGNVGFPVAGRSCLTGCWCLCCLAGPLTPGPRRRRP